MHAAQILQYLKKQGQSLDSEVATAMKLPLDEVRASLTAMSERGEIMRCSVTRFYDGNPVEEMQSRVAGFIPPAAPGRKPGAKT